MGKLFADFEFYDVQATRKEIQELKNEVSELKDEVTGLKDEILKYRRLLEENGIIVSGQGFFRRALEALWRKFSRNIGQEISEHPRESVPLH